MIVPRIPYTAPFPPPAIFPSSATSLSAAVSATASFFTRHKNMLLITGAGISVESGLADYRGEKGTYRLNHGYRPVFYSEFATHHEARKRYWARSFLGWPTLERAQPNRAHLAVGKLWEKGLITGVITQNVDSLHSRTPLVPPVIELHGTLRTLLCLTCQSHIPRQPFQETLARLNPQWADFLRTAVEAGAFDAESSKGIRTNPDGDVDLPGASYALFRYPPCPQCLRSYPDRVNIDSDGAQIPEDLNRHSTGVLKPAVIFFGESLSDGVREAAKGSIEKVDAVLVVGSSLATYSAWRLVKDAYDTGKGIGIINIGGVRGEEQFFERKARGERLRVEFKASDVLDGVLKEFGVA